MSPYMQPELISEPLVYCVQILPSAIVLSFFFIGDDAMGLEGRKDDASSCLALGGDFTWLEHTMTHSLFDSERGLKVSPIAVGYRTFSIVMCDVALGAMCLSLLWTTLKS